MRFEGFSSVEGEGSVDNGTVSMSIVMLSMVVLVMVRVIVAFGGSCNNPSSSDRYSSASRIAIMKEDKRSIAAEKELNCSNWLTISERSRNT